MAEVDRERVQNTLERERERVEEKRGFGGDCNILHK